MIFFISATKEGNMTIERPNSYQNREDDLRARFTSWISVIVWRARRDYFKAQKGRFREIPIEEIDEIPDDTGFEILERDEFIFADMNLAAQFQELPMCQQQVLALRFAKGLSPSEIAEVIGCNSRRVSQQLYRALTRLRHGLDQRDDICDHECL